MRAMNIGIKQTLVPIVLLLVLVLSSQLYAGCSDDIGRVTINEVNVHNQSQQSGGYYVEVKALDNELFSAERGNWSLVLCSASGANDGTPCQAVSLAGGSISGPWLVVDEEDLNWDYLDLDNGSGHGMEIVLRDQNGDTVDYLSVDGYSSFGDSSCEFQYDTAYAGGNNFNIQRQPDGYGDWDDTGGGNSGDETENDSNTEVSANSPAVSVRDVSALSNSIMTFVFTLSAPTLTDVEIAYSSLDGTAIGGSDYLGVSGTVTIAAGQTSASVPVSILNTGNIPSYFYLLVEEVLSVDKKGVANAKITNNLATGTILGSSGMVTSYFFNESAWDGTAQEVVDSGVNGYHATSVSGATTAITSPALPGDPGTCAYGEFDGVDDYVALPDTYPDLTADFTITAWIRTRDNSQPHQRIFVDDANNSQGFGLSLADTDNDDPDNTGQLRFYSRSTSPISLDTPAVIENDQWYFVAAVADMASKTKRIYVYAQDGTLLSEVEGSYDGSWGGDTGAASVAGENTASAETSYRFNGNIDEVRVHAGALNQAEIEAVMASVHECVEPAVAEYRFDLCSETDVVIDDSGNGFNGTVLNGPLEIGTGYTCNAAVFDGIDDYAVVDDADLFDDTEVLTISAWINPLAIRNAPPTGNARGIISKRNRPSSEAAYGIFFYSARKDGKLYVDLDTENNRFSSNSTIPEDTWTHFAVVFDGSLPANQRAKLYINGVLDKTARETSERIPGYSSDVYIGNLYYGPEVLKVFKGMIDELRIIRSALSAEEVGLLYSSTRSGCQVCAETDFDHLRIEHSGAGLTCAPSEVIVRACADEECSEEYTDPVYFSLQPLAGNPGWIGGSARTLIDGHLPFDFRQNTPATVSLGITNISPAPVNGYQCYDSGVAGDCGIEFYDSGFIYDVPDLTSGKASSAVAIQAVRTDLTTQTCVADDSFSGVSKTINFWSNYINPASGSRQVTIAGSRVATTYPGTGVSLSFNAAATAYFTVSYPDAGQVQLDARYAGSSGTDEESLVMLGTDSFIARPAGLCVYSDDANADCASGGGACSAFTKVDQTFNLKIKGVGWEADADTDLCSGNATTPNFRLSGIALNHNLVAPTGSGVASGSIGVTLIDIGAADSGEHVISNQTVSEVGVYTFTATPPYYFDEPLPPATSANIGRFIPDHFITEIVNSGSFEDACSGFTYSGQAFGYAAMDRPQMKITAVGGSGATQVNYRDSFVKLTDPATQISMPGVTTDASHYGADGAALLNLTWGAGMATLTANNDGTLNFRLGADQFTYVHEPNAQVDPFVSDIRLRVVGLTDSDSISAGDLPRTFTLTGTEIRYGRLLLQNAYGPETLPLPIPLRSEYYVGGSYLLNNLDSCSSYSSVDLQLSNYLGRLVDGDLLKDGSGALVAGEGSSMSLTEQGVVHEGSVDLLYNLSAMPWLQYDWDGDGIYDNPSARATFGIFKGNERLIYMRESLW